MCERLGSFRFLENPLHSLHVSQVVECCLSGSQADLDYTFCNQADELCRVNLHIVPLPALVAARLGRLLMDNSQPQGFSILGKPFKECRCFPFNGVC